MRKHDVRKWLHAILDLLPVFVIPLFMIYSSNKNYTSTLAIDIPEYQEVDFNQQVKNGNFTDFTSWSIIYSGNNPLANVVVDDNLCELTPVSYLGGISQYGVNIVPYHKYLAKINYLNTTNKLQFLIYDNTYNRYVMGNDTPSNYVGSKTITFTSNTLSDSVCRLSVITTDQSDFGTSIFSYIQLFDLTQMFGEGNEPTSTDFNSWFVDNYYDYVLSHIELVDVGNQSFNDTDVGSQMFYTLYNTVDKYFNMGDVFNLNGVYDWFNLNIFHGNIPPAMYVVWQIVLYEFVMDLLFLLYGLFMWFIDMVEKLMDKPFKSIK